MPLLFLWLSQLADVSSTLAAIHGGAVEGNPLGLSRLLILKAALCVTVTVGWFYLSRWRWIFGPALYFGSGATALVAAQNMGWLP